MTMTVTAIDEVLAGWERSLGGAARDRLEAQCCRLVSSDG